MVAVYLRVEGKTAADFNVAYRSVVGTTDEWFLGATLLLDSDRDADLSSITALMRERSSSQPLGQRSCGSVFRNPPGGFAAQLIEAAGLKGLSVGDAVISKKHANFIINTGAARAEDVERLIEMVRDRVEANSDVALELEVRILGERRA